MNIIELLSSQSGSKSYELTVESWIDGDRCLINLASQPTIGDSNYPCDILKPWDGEKTPKQPVTSSID